MKNIPIILQTDVGGCGLASLAMIASHFGGKINLQNMRELFPSTKREVPLAQLMQYASSLNLNTRALRVDLNQISKLKLPCILHWDKNHYVVLREIQYDYRNRGLLVLLDPAYGERKIYIKNASAHFAGIALEISIDPSFVTNEDFSNQNANEIQIKTTNRFSIELLVKKLFHLKTLFVLGVCHLALIPFLQNSNNEIVGVLLICETFLFLYFFLRYRNTETIIVSERNLSRGFEYLTAGNFSKGWEFYEWRWKTPLGQFAIRQFEQPRWNGETSLEDKSILIYWEQGLGDTIQFCRYIEMVANLGAKVYFEVQPPLVKLLHDIKGASEVIGAGTPLPEFDFHCPLLSLPRIFKTQMTSIPSNASYLSPRIDDLNKWANKLGNKTKPRIGIVWSGNAKHANDQNRSIPLSLLMSYLNGLDQFEFFSLQREVRSIDQSTLDENLEVKHFGIQLNDFSDTAALCELMDIVVSVDTSVAHLSAAIGKTTFVLLPYVADWRWLEKRIDSPWYKSVKLFRQHKSGDWSKAMRNLVLDLRSATL